MTLHLTAERIDGESFRYAIEQDDGLRFEATDPIDVAVELIRLDVDGPLHLLDGARQYGKIRINEHRQAVAARLKLQKGARAAAEPEVHPELKWSGAGRRTLTQQGSNSRRDLFR